MFQHVSLWPGCGEEQSWRNNGQVGGREPPSALLTLGGPGLKSHGILGNVVLCLRVGEGQDKTRTGFEGGMVGPVREVKRPRVFHLEGNEERQRGAETCLGDRDRDHENDREKVDDRSDR